jgi:hypothetical protein
MKFYIHDLVLHQLEIKSNVTDRVLHYDNSACVQTRWLSIANTVTYASTTVVRDLIISVPR